jgi:DNA polymerase-3 subunit delta'
MSFQAILDQDIAVRALRAAIEKKRVAHAYVFVGLSGVGRKLAASVFARSLNCEQPRGADPCDACASCRLIAEGKHPDVQTIMPIKRSSTITVEQIEALLPFAYMRPLKGKHKVFIFCEADRLRVETANKMLKTLEEPPPQTTFVLITERIESVLPTVASRCQPIKFGRLRTESVERILVADFGVDPHNAAVAAGLAGGQVTRGLEFADPTRTEIVHDIVKSLASLPARMSLYDGLLAFFAERKEALQSEAEERISDFGEDLAASVKTSIEDLRKSYVDRHYKDLLNDCLGLLLTLYRDILVVKETNSEELIIHRNRIDFLRERAESMSVESIVQNMREIEEASQFCSHFVGEDRVFMDLMLSLRGT